MVKKINKISAVLLCAAMLFSSIVIQAEDFSKENTADFIPLETKAFDALWTMDLLTEDFSAMSADGFVTRAQFIGNLFKIVGYERKEFKSSEIPFIDVNADTAYKDEICSFYEMGIISGKTENTFSPNDTVSYAEAVKMIIDVLGYKEYTAVKHGAYPNGYLAAAQKLKLGKNLQNANGVVCYKRLIYQYKSKRKYERSCA